MVAALLAVALAPALAGTPACRDLAISWAAAAAVRPAPVRPSATPGLRLVRLVRPDPRCASATLDALYRGPGARLRLVQGGSRCCGEGGGSPVAGRPTVPGWAATLYRFGEPPGGPGRGWTLYLRRPGVEVALTSYGVPRARLLAIARSLRAVPPGRA